MFNIGDRVTICKPSYASKAWLRDMDRYNGATGEILGFLGENHNWVGVYGCGPWWYKLEWLTPEEVQDDNFEAEDLSQLI